MARKIKVEFERGGKFVATMLEEEAPETVNVVWNSLPLELPVKHSMWSGQAVTCSVKTKLKTIENGKRIMPPGSISYITRFMSLGPANKLSPDEITFIYGPRYLAHATLGIPSLNNHFATITEGNLNEFEEIGPRIREKGMEKVRITKV